MNKQKSINHYILLLSQKKVSLMKLHDTNMEEVIDGIFPASFTDDYEYAKSSRGTSFGYALKSFEKDKSFVKKERFNHFLSFINEKLKQYLNSDSDLLIAGTDEDRSDFKRVSTFNDRIIGEIKGSFSSNFSKLRQSITDRIKEKIK